MKKMYRVELVDCDVPVEWSKVQCEKLEAMGYVATKTVDWNIVYEHPDLGDREDILRRHNEYVDYLESKEDAD